MKKILICLVLIISVTLNAQEKTVYNPAGSKGIIANFSGFDLSFGADREARPINFKLGVSGYYFFAEQWAVCPGLNFGVEHLKPVTNYSFDYTLGVRRWFKWWFVGLWYEGITYNNFNNYENGLKFDFGYTININETFFIEPTLYYEKTFQTLNIHRLGVGLSLGIAL